MEVEDLWTAMSLRGDTLHAFDKLEDELRLVTFLGHAGNAVVYKLHGNADDGPMDWWEFRQRFAVFTTYEAADNRRNELRHRTVSVG